MGTNWGDESADIGLQKSESNQQCVVIRKPPRLGIVTLCRLMDDCLPEQIETEADMQNLIDKLWPALVCEFEIYI